MLRLRGAMPFDKRLYAQTVTVYHREGLTRHVLRGVHFEENRLRDTAGGITQDREEFLLVVPFACHLQPGDKVLPGEGPVPQDWGTLRAWVIRSVKPRYLLGKFCHVEARG